jgi:integrase
VRVAVDLRTVLAVGERLPAQEALMAVIALFTGMRWGEVCGMRRQYLHALGEPGGPARTNPDMRKQMIDGLERVWANRRKAQFKP